MANSAQIQLFSNGNLAIAPGFPLSEVGTKNLSESIVETGAHDVIRIFGLLHDRRRPVLRWLAGCANVRAAQQGAEAMAKARVILAAIGLAAAISGARAADYAGDVPVARAPEIWQGHFTGGRNAAPGAQPTALDWVDSTQRFASLRECGRWMRGLTRQYRTYEGWKGCLRIR